jgi:hypothetical protein
LTFFLPISLFFVLQSEMDYTVIHPGGLVDTTPGGREEFVLDVDDNLYKTHTRTSISRENVADLCVAALSVGKGRNVSFDCITQASSLEDGVPSPSAEEAFSEFLDRSTTSNYAL